MFPRLKIKDITFKSDIRKANSSYNKNIKTLKMRLSRKEKSQNTAVLYKIEHFFVLMEKPWKKPGLVI